MSARALFMAYDLWVWADDLLSDVDPAPPQPTHWMPLPPDPEPAP